MNDDEDYDYSNEAEEPSAGAEVGGLVNGGTNLVKGGIQAGTNLAHGFPQFGVGGKNHSSDIGADGPDLNDKENPPVGANKNSNNEMPTNNGNQGNKGLNSVENNNSNKQAGPDLKKPNQNQNSNQNKDEDKDKEKNKDKNKNQTDGDKDKEKPNQDKSSDNKNKQSSDSNVNKFNFKDAAKGLGKKVLDAGGRGLKNAGDKLSGSEGQEESEEKQEAKKVGGALAGVIAFIIRFPWVAVILGVMAIALFTISMIAINTAETFSGANFSGWYCPMHSPVTSSVGYVSGMFAWRVYDGVADAHKGVDVSFDDAGGNGKGPEVVSTQKGKIVEWYEEDSEYGIYILVDWDNGSGSNIYDDRAYRTLYTHLCKMTSEATTEVEGIAAEIRNADGEPGEIQLRDDCEKEGKYRDCDYQKRCLEEKPILLGETNPSLTTMSDEAGESSSSTSSEEECPSGYYIVGSNLCCPYNYKYVKTKNMCYYYKWTCAVSQSEFEKKLNQYDVGSIVEAGDIIEYVSDTGTRSKDCDFHVHYEVQEDLVGDDPDLGYMASTTVNRFFGLEVASYGCDSIRSPIIGEDLITLGSGSSIISSSSSKAPTLAQIGSWKCNTPTATPDTLYEYCDEGTSVEEEYRFKGSIGPMNNGDGTSTPVDLSGINGANEGEGGVEKFGTGDIDLCDDIADIIAEFNNKKGGITTGSCINGATELLDQTFNDLSFDIIKAKTGLGSGTLSGPRYASSNSTELKAGSLFIYDSTVGEGEIYGHIGVVLSVVDNTDNTKTVTVWECNWTPNTCLERTITVLGDNLAEYGNARMIDLKLLAESYCSSEETPQTPSGEATE